MSVIIRTVFQENIYFETFCDGLKQKTKNNKTKSWQTHMYMNLYI